MNRVARAKAARKAASRETAVVHRMAALLLEYPSAELLELLPQLRAAAAELRATYRAPLEEVLDHLAGSSLTELEARYVETFDLRRRCSLYLTYFAYGDTRKRGVALVEFKQAYRNAGFELSADELPDHLAVVLEFTSSGVPATGAGAGSSGAGSAVGAGLGARVAAAKGVRRVIGSGATEADPTSAQEAGLRLLLGHRAGLELLRLALADSGSPYAGVLTAVCATLPPLEGDEREAVATLAAEGPPGEEVGLEPFAPPSYMPDSPTAPYAGPLTTSGARR